MLKFSSWTIAAIMAMSVVCQSATAEPYEEGKHYTVITPAIKVGKENEVIVTEFFWYGCSHCYAFEDMLHAWADKLPAGARLEPSPAMWARGMDLHARAYYVAKSLKVLDQVHEPIFKKMHLERKRLGSQAEIRQVFVANGVDADAFDTAWDSFGIESQVRQANSRMRAAQVNGTPSMMINGKYRIDTRHSGTQGGMLEVADYLIQKELAAMASDAGGEASD